MVDHVEVNTETEKIITRQVALVCGKSNVQRLRVQLESNDLFGKKISPYLDLDPPPPLRSLTSGKEISAEGRAKLISKNKEPLFALFTNLTINILGGNLLDFIAKRITNLTLFPFEVFLLYADLGSNFRISNKSDGLLQEDNSNPLVRTCIDFVCENPPFTEHANPGELIPYIPRRWSIYPPLVLLPPNAFDSQGWQRYINSELNEEQRNQFFRTVLETISPKATHLAINAPIPSSNNIMRKPVDITPLYGDFGLSRLSPEERQNSTEETFNNAFWCTVVQNSIFQTWCPLHTMFSRGNIAEKTRIINEFSPDSIRDKVVVDLYAGIGYFAFSYVYAGAAVVFCWEINPWSCEGLLRGARKNGWKAVLVKENEDLSANLNLEEIGDSIRIILFMEDNKNALSRMEEWSRYLKDRGKKTWLIGHVNLGILPTSRDRWGIAVKLVAILNWENHCEEDVWIHVHENMAQNEIEQRKEEVIQAFTQILQGSQAAGPTYEVRCDKVFQLKTFAPGVLHCVIDVHLSPQSLRA